MEPLGIAYSHAEAAMTSRLIHAFLRRRAAVERCLAGTAL